MKKSIFTLLLLSSIIANAQFAKGDKYLGGNVGLAFSTSSFHQNNAVSDGTGNNFGISLNPQFLKAANANTLRGFTVGLNFLNSTTNQNQNLTHYKNVSNSIGTSIGYVIRKYNTIAGKIFWYMEYNANVGYSYSWQTNTSTSTNISTSVKQDAIGYYAVVSALPALAVKASDRLLVDVNFGGLSTGYNYSSSEGNHNHSYSVNLNLTSRFTLGLLWKLKKSARS